MMVGLEEAVDVLMANGSPGKGIEFESCLIWLAMD
jgi:hypothetical protein